jgi:hypothetical protein
MSIWLIFFWLSGIGWTADSEVAEPWTVTVELSLHEATSKPIRVEVDWLGSHQPKVLRDDGQDGDRIAGDNILSAKFMGAPTRFLPVEFSRMEDSNWISGHRSVEQLPWEGGRLSFGTTNTPNLTIQRLSQPGTIEQVESSEAIWTAGGMVWAWLCLLFVLSLVPLSKSEPSGDPIDRGRWTSPILWLGLATLWTWPALIAGGDRAVGRHFDLSGTIWSLSAIPRLLPDLTDGLTAWPIGANYTAFDSFMLIPFGYLLQWVDPVQLHSWLAIVGVGSSAWAAEHFARALGARRPWSLIAGLTFGFSGLAATALLEGHVYHVIDPWLPLFALYWWKTCDRSGTNRDGLLAGLFFVLTLLTTAYLGVAAAIIAIGFAAGGLGRAGLRLSPVASAAAAAVPASLVLLWGIIDHSGGPESTHRILLGSAQISNLSMATPEIDRASHSVAAGLGGVAFALTWLAPAILRPGRWKVLFWTGAGAFLLSFGPVLALSPETTLVALPTYPLWDLPVLGHIRFPMRLLWAWLLCSGVLAALVATSLARQRRAGWLVGLALIHAFGFVGLPLRQSSMLASTPSAYGQIDEGAIFELVPTGADPSGEFDNWMSATSCLYQTDHGRGIAENCVALPVQQNPRMKLSKWVEGRLLEGKAELVRDTLEGLGFGGMAWHPDLYSLGDRTRLGKTLSLWSGAEKTVDGGEHIWLYPLQPSEPYTLRLPQDEPASSHGQTESSLASGAHNIFIDLQVHYSPTSSGKDEGEAVPQWDTPDYFVRYQLFDGTQKSAPLTNDSTTFGDWKDDYTWTTMLEGPLPERMDLELLSRTKGAASVLWSGAVQVTSDNDRLAFLLDEGQARPVNAGAERPAPPARRGAGIIALMGWLGWIALVGMWILRRRRFVQRY